jgi:uncharacterized protein
MNPLDIICKYCTNEKQLHILLVHSRAVADKALRIARRHPEWRVDELFIEEAALLHDIGITYVNAPAIECYGEEPYIRHGILGAEILRNEGLDRHALVCERHTGTGLTLQQIVEQGLPLPQRDMQPVSLEEQIICFADKFFSKTHLGEEKPLERVKASLAKHDPQYIEQFDEWNIKF